VVTCPACGHCDWRVQSHSPVRPYVRSNKIRVLYVFYDR